MFMIIIGAYRYSYLDLVNIVAASEDAMIVFIVSWNITAPDEDDNTEQDTLSECSNRSEIQRKTVAQAF